MLANKTMLFKHVSIHKWGHLNHEERFYIILSRINMLQLLTIIVH